MVKKLIFDSTQSGCDLAPTIIEQCKLRGKEQKHVTCYN
ncbi:hypothetical protein PRUB_a0775 [Pseudoalteromonas rubra]|uniref:Uncharacterized protein n=1 Tax=Pseudoalteromonas rubra TaxID=43658 RepID=A0A8T0C674_9GAMM|nr:hypothetical protein PRUB_a0775 [Pseudoalteromonas rubra]